MKVEMDEGLAFGLGVFETIRIEQGKAILLKEHISRMRHGIRRLGIEREEVNRWLTPEKIYDWMKERSMDQGAIKIIVTGENILFSERENPYKPADYEKGFHLAFSQVRRNETSPLTYLKTLNYGDNILEKRKAKREGADEPLFLNTRGEITEGAVTNIFFVKDGRLYTPSVSCGLLPGTVRAFIIRNFSVCETVIRPEETENFQEAFVTNSLLGIMPVASLGEKNLRNVFFYQKQRKCTEICCFRKSSDTPCAFVTMCYNCGG
ncbi:MAG: aminotransferase class IV [Ruminococcus sp.]|jgi:4-amino-4-deoxychorismate lyase